MYYLSIISKALDCTHSAGTGPSAFDWSRSILLCLVSQCLTHAGPMQGICS